MSYCCDIPEAEDMLALRNDAAVKRTCVRCTINEADIISGGMAAERSVRETKIIRSQFLEITKTIQKTSKM